VPSKLKTRLVAIIDVSQQLLLELDIDIEKADNDQALIDNKAINAKQNKVNDEKRLRLMTDRQSLISQLFEQYTQKQLSSELKMINEMVVLNNQLVRLSQSKKQMFALQITKLKKSDKIKNLYQKY
jgi:UDP-galactopyranose mutase